MKPNIDVTPIVAKITAFVKSEGVFDQFRRDCNGDITRMEKYHQLEYLVQEYATKWLFNEMWTEASNKNKYRNDLRQQVDRSNQVKTTLDSIISLNLTSRIENFRSRIEDVVRDYINKEEERKKLTENKGEINTSRCWTKKLSDEITSLNQTQENSARFELIANTLVNDDNATLKVVPTGDRNSGTVALKSFQGNDKNNAKSFMDGNKNVIESAIEISKTISTGSTVQKNEMKSSLESVTSPIRILYENIKDVPTENCGARSPVEVTKNLSTNPSNLINSTISKGNQGKDMPFEKKMSVNSLLNTPLHIQNTLLAATDMKSKNATETIYADHTDLDMNMSSEFDKKKAFPKVDIRHMTMTDCQQDHCSKHNTDANNRKPESDNNESLDDSLSCISEEVSSVHTSDLSSFNDDISSISSQSLSSSSSDIAESNIVKTTEADSEFQMQEGEYVKQNIGNQTDDIKDGKSRKQPNLRIKRRSGRNRLQRLINNSNVINGSQSRGIITRRRSSARLDKSRNR